ncbi:MAG: hypothetical protein AB1510_10030 [Bacillota bacterium]
MKKFLAALVTLCLLLMLVAPAAYASSFGKSNVSSWDIELQQQKETEQPLALDEAIRKLE